jgi:polar amino acid transport system permease protein
MLSDIILIVRDNWLLLLIGQYPNGPLGGLALTVLLAALGLLLAFPLGLLLGLARISEHRALRWPVTALVFVVRGIPLLMVVFWAYFFLPSVTGHKTDQFTTMLIALVVFDGVYIAEARSLGFNRFGALRYVILPQALRHMLPSLVNQFVSTIKETSLGYIIGLTEVAFITTQINTQVFTKPVQVYATLALTYFVLCFGLSRVAYAMEKRLAQGNPGPRHQPG